LIERTLPTEAIQVEHTSGQLDIPEMSYEQIKIDAKLALKLVMDIGKPKAIAIEDLLRFEPFSFFKAELELELS
jgi:hypothetical protein